MIFTEDWTTRFAPIWWHGLSQMAGAPGLQGLEVGTFEGRSAIWFLEHVLTGPGARLTCIDQSPSPYFAENMRRFCDRYSLIQCDTARAMVDLPKEFFDFAYVDASSEATCTVLDGTLAFRLVRPGGVLIFDGPHAEGRRKRGIDAFFCAHSHLCEVLHSEIQTVLVKTASEECRW